jgi:hypothetical protein
LTLAKLEYLQSSMRPSSSSNILCSVPLLMHLLRGPLWVVILELLFGHLLTLIVVACKSNLGWGQWTN